MFSRMSLLEETRNSHSEHFWEGLSQSFVDRALKLGWDKRKLSHWWGVYQRNLVVPHQHTLHHPSTWEPYYVFLGYDLAVWELLRCARREAKAFGRWRGNKFQRIIYRRGHQAYIRRIHEMGEAVC